MYGSALVPAFKIKELNKDLVVPVYKKTVTINEPHPSQK